MNIKHLCFLFVREKEEGRGREVTRKQYSAGAGAPAVTMAVEGGGEGHQLVLGSGVQCAALTPWWGARVKVEDSEYCL